MTASKLKWYSDLKTELKKYRIPVEDVWLFAKAVRGLGQYGYDVNKIIAELLKLDSLKRQFQFYTGIIPALENKCANLNGECTSLEQTLITHRQTISIYN
jgi:hypothetical protein